MARRGSASAILVAVLALAACDPFGLPPTRALEDGAAGMLGRGQSFEMAGSYAAGGGGWQIDMQVAGTGASHVLATSNGSTVEAITIGADAYYRGRQFLARQLSGNPLGSDLAKAAGNAWWKAAAGQVPTMPDFTDGATFRATFLGSAATQRDDHAGVAGAIKLSGERADVYISATPPYPLVRVELKKGVVVDGIRDARFSYSNPGVDFHIAAPTDLIDFGNQSTLPPIYTVVSIDTSRCTAPCVVSATLKNLGGTAPAQQPARVEFVMAGAAASTVRLGSCLATIQPDVGYNSTTSVSCTIDTPGQNAAYITATPENSSRA